MRGRWQDLVGGGETDVGAGSREAVDAVHALQQACLGPGNAECWDTLYSLQCRLTGQEREPRAEAVGDRPHHRPGKADYCITSPPTGAM